MVRLVIWDTQRPLWRHCNYCIIQYYGVTFAKDIHIKSEQLERLRSEDTPAASWLPILLSHIGSQVKRRQSQSYKFKEFAKILNSQILKLTLHATHLLKLLDKMRKYGMDPTSIVEDTERTRFCPQTDRRTRWNQYTPLSTSLKRGYNYWSRLIERETISIILYVSTFFKKFINYSLITVHKYTCLSTVVTGYSFVTKLTLIN